MRIRAAQEYPMAQEKDERSGTAGRRTSETADDSARRGAGSTARSAGREATHGGNGGVASSPRARRLERYLIGPRFAPGAQPFGYPEQSLDAIVEYLTQQEHAEIVRRIKLSGAHSFAADESVNEVVVAKIEEGRAERLRAAAPPHLIIERDSFLRHADHLGGSARGMLTNTLALNLLPLRSVATELAIRVVGEHDQPLAKATVVVEGANGLPAQALTDESGTARVTFFGGPIESVQTLFVRAAANHWDRQIAAPVLGPGTNTVKLRALSDSFVNFPGERLIGWGQRLMRLDPAIRRLSGAGVRIGLIDSGCDNSHPLLRHVTRGKDLAEDSDADWTQDPVSHGTHCAGILNAANTGQGIVGCAPEAELHVFKVLPGGRTSDLLVALDECIERQLDVINISAVSDEYSELVAQKLQEALQKGIACIAAAGNSGGPVGFPAVVPGVMAVAAVGKLREFPADSSHICSVIPQLIGADGIFAARFSCAGPQVAVSGPGVAVISTVPGGGYAAADGTSAAAAHVSGFAALMLAHHPVFAEGVFRSRSEQRVQALFELIRTSALPHFADPQRGGAGVPDAQRVPWAQELAAGLPGSTGAERAPAAPSHWAAAAAARAWPSFVQMRAAGLI
jgi:subtilisin